MSAKIEFNNLVSLISRSNVLSGTKYDLKGQYIQYLLLENPDLLC